uniref:50S ribosomal protein L20 n=1 Tax=Boodleopsis sp. FL1161 TaxID=2364084 RepID=A0A386AZ88_9CHLO|nr:ribosomal protein L20 [Boodleopsis sp. FL1161]
MTRVKRGQNIRKRHKKKMNTIQKFCGTSSTLYKNANQKLSKSLQTAFIGRRLFKRDYRSLWICRTNAKVRELGFNYHIFSAKKKFAQLVNRKTLAQLVIQDPQIFYYL